MAERRRRIQKPPNDPLAWVDKEISSTTDIKTDASQEETPVIEASKTNFLNGKYEMTEEKMTSGSLLGDVKIEHLLEGVSTCLQLADENYNIIYMNPSLMGMFSNAESDIRKDLPQFNKNTLIGTNMDIFHRNPSHQRKMMDGLRGKASTEINLGGRTFSLSATPLFDNDGKRTNTIVEWNDVTAIKQATDVLFSVASGDLTRELTPCDDEGTVKKLHESVCLLKENIARMVSDANILTVAAVEGRLATRADATKHQGDFRKIVEGVNDTLDAVIGPLNVAADYVNNISQGNIPAKITDTYNGDFNVLKNNLNTCIDAVNALVSDANILSVAAVEGKLATRADATKHQGDFRKIVVGVNDTLDAVIGPLNVAADYVDKISQGNIPAKITDTYNGDFNVLKNNLNTCIDAVNFIIEDASMMSNAIVDGNLAITVNADRHQGDYRKIIDAFESALVGLNDTFYQINDAIQEVASSATQLSASSQNMAANSEEQSSAVEEITSALEETDSQVKANTENANSANQLVMITSDAANQGQAKMQAMSVAMSSINDSAQSIAKIIKVIDEIAFQTNLLALNAAVEAARAGQHGRGFAVVAQEVRNLAGRSAKAARETADLIEDSTKRVSDGVNIAAETGQALDKIVTNVTKVKNLVSEISTASMEQSRGVSQINIAMGQVASAAREGSLQSEEQALSSTGLTAVASRTQQELSRFKLRSRQRSSGLLSLDGITPDVLRQLQAMLAQQKVAPAAPKAAPAKPATVAAAPVKKSPKQVMPLDSDERGFDKF